MPEQGEISAGSVGEGTVAVDFIQFCSHFGLFPAPGFGFPRHICHAWVSPPPLSSRAFRETRFPEKQGFFQTQGGTTSEKSQSTLGYAQPRRAPAAQPEAPREPLPAFKPEFPTQFDFMTQFALLEPGDAGSGLSAVTGQRSRAGPCPEEPVVPRGGKSRDVGYSAKPPTVLFHQRANRPAQAAQRGPARTAPESGGISTSLSANRAWVGAPRAPRHSPENKWLS